MSSIIIFNYELIPFNMYRKKYKKIARVNFRFFEIVLLEIYKIKDLIFSIDIILKKYYTYMIFHIFLKRSIMKNRNS